MSSVHYAELYRWDELYVLLIRSPHLLEEIGLIEILLKNKAPMRIINLDKSFKIINNWKMLLDKFLKNIKS